MIESSRSQDEAPGPSDDAEVLENVRRLTVHIQQLVNELTRHNTLLVHKRINQSYYMQKHQELLLLSEQLTSARRQLDRVVRRAALHYEQVFLTWLPDVRWLQQHLREGGKATPDSKYSAGL